ncbi:MAG: HD domain-containing protein [Treponema sp.]|nr:HD domain-containing protein [Treponema sp.]
MLALHPQQKFDLSKYHKILCPADDYPAFLDKYIALSSMQRLKGIGLLCGTDWTKLYKNRLYYSRLDHSIGVALIVWHFTHDKAQTLAGLFHDISTSVFSHVSDFRKGDALTQTLTEGPTATIIRSDKELQALLQSDGISSSAVEDYHLYPVADNEIPQLSADRLEYMFPSGMALDGSWTMEEIETCYKDIEVLTNEEDKPELGFRTLEIAEEYCRHFCMIGHILQLNENKLALNMLGVIMNLAVEEGLLTEKDFMTLSEGEVIGKLEEGLKKKDKNSVRLARLYYTFRNMTSIEHCDKALPENDYFCVSLKVKQRYINPLVKNKNGTCKRLYELSEKGKTYIDDFKAYSDTAYGCVRLI